MDGFRDRENLLNIVKLSAIKETFSFCNRHSGCILNAGGYEHVEEDTAKMRCFHRLLMVMVSVFWLITAASAQIPTKGNIFFGYSYVSADTDSNAHANLNGWNGSLEGKVFPYVGIVADISAHYGSAVVPAIFPPQGPKDLPGRLYSVLFGPRISVPVGKFTPFVHAMFGVSHTSGASSGLPASDTSFGTALGGGIDYKLIHAVGWRVQADLLQTRFYGATQDNFRLSTGIVFHF